MSTIDPQAQEFAIALLNAHAIHVNESNLFFNARTHRVDEFDVRDVTKQLASALRFVLQDQAQVTLVQLDDAVTISINAEVVIRYQRTWFGRWVSKRRDQLVQVQTVRFGEFLSGLIACVFTATGSLLTGT